MILMATLTAALNDVFAGSQWQAWFAGPGLAMLALLGCLRLVGIPGWLGPAVGLFVGALAVFGLYGAGDGLVRLLPTPATLGRLRDMLVEGSVLIAEGSTPIDPTPPLLLIAALGATLLALLLDTLAIGARLPALAAIATMLTLFVPVSVNLTGLHLGRAAAAIAATLLVLWVGSPRWVRPRAVGEGVRRRLGPASCRATAATATIALVASGAGLAGGVFPGRVLGPLVDALPKALYFANGPNPLVDLGADLAERIPKEALRLTTEIYPPPYLRATTLEDFTGDTWRHRTTPSLVTQADGERELEVLPEPGLWELGSQIEVTGMRSDWLPVPYPPRLVTQLDGTWTVEEGDLSIRALKGGAQGKAYSTRTPVDSRLDARGNWFQGQAAQFGQVVIGDDANGYVVGEEGAIGFVDQSKGVVLDLATGKRTSLTDPPAGGDRPTPATTYQLRSGPGGDADPGVVGGEDRSARTAVPVGPGSGAGTREDPAAGTEEDPGATDGMPEDWGRSGTVRGGVSEGTVTVEVDPETGQVIEYTPSGVPPEQVGADTDWARLLAHDLALPDDLPAIISQTAARVTAGSQGVASFQAGMLEAFLRNSGGFAYSTSAPGEGGYDGDSAEVIARFLEVRAGYCIHFASAMALMARTLGIPSRIAIGYMPGQATDLLSGYRRLYVVTSKALHAWPELYIPNIGWMAYEPTPGRTPGAANENTESSAGAGGTPSSSPSASSSPSSSPTARPSARSSAAARGPRGTHDAGVDLTEFYWLAVLLGAAVALGTVPGLVRARRRSGRLAVLDGGGPRAVGAGWAEVRDTARDLGLGAPVTETPAAFAARLERWWSLAGAGPPVSEAEVRARLAKLTGAVERQAFAGEPAVGAGGARGPRKAGPAGPSREAGSAGRDRPSGGGAEDGAGEIWNVDRAGVRAIIARSRAAVKRRARLMARLLPISLVRRVSQKRRGLEPPTGKETTEGAK
jgi:transglutaminase-like putative cysteine protease